MVTSEVVLVDFDRLEFKPSQPLNSSSEYRIHLEFRLRGSHISLSTEADDLILQRASDGTPQKLSRDSNGKEMSSARNKSNYGPMSDREGYVGEQISAMQNRRTSVKPTSTAQPKTPKANKKSQSGTPKGSNASNTRKNEEHNSTDNLTKEWTNFQQTLQTRLTSPTPRSKGTTTPTRFGGSMTESNETNASSPNAKGENILTTPNWRSSLDMNEMSDYPSAHGDNKDVIEDPLRKIDWTFFTKGYSHPQLVKTFPAHKQEGVSRIQTIQLCFDRPFDAELARRHIKISPPHPIVLTPHPSHPSIISLIPLSPYPPLTVYHVYISKWLRDFTRQRFTHGFVISFKTRSVFTLPRSVSLNSFVQNRTSTLSGTFIDALPLPLNSDIPYLHFLTRDAEWGRTDPDNNSDIFSSTLERDMALEDRALDRSFVSDPFLQTYQSGALSLSGVQRSPSQQTSPPKSTTKKLPLQLFHSPFCDSTLIRLLTAPSFLPLFRLQNRFLLPYYCIVIPPSMLPNFLVPRPIPNERRDLKKIVTSTSQDRREKEERLKEEEKLLEQQLIADDAKIKAQNEEQQKSSSAVPSLLSPSVNDNPSSEQFDTRRSTSRDDQSSITKPLTPRSPTTPTSAAIPPFNTESPRPTVENTPKTEGKPKFQVAPISTDNTRTIADSAGQTERRNIQPKRLQGRPNPDDEMVGFCVGTARPPILTLHAYLHSQCTHMGYAELIKIVFGIASGMHTLHTHTPNPILHGSLHDSALIHLTPQTHAPLLSFYGLGKITLYLSHARATRRSTGVTLKLRTKREYVTQELLPQSTQNATLTNAMTLRMNFPIMEQFLVPTASMMKKKKSGKMILGMESDDFNIVDTTKSGSVAITSNDPFINSAPPPLPPKALFVSHTSPFKDDVNALALLLFEMCTNKIPTISQLEGIHEDEVIDSLIEQSKAIPWPFVGFLIKACLGRAGMSQLPSFFLIKELCRIELAGLMEKELRRRQNLARNKEYLEKEGERKQKQEQAETERRKIEEEKQREREEAIKYGLSIGEDGSTTNTQAGSNYPSSSVSPASQTHTPKTAEIDEHDIFEETAQMLDAEEAKHAPILNKRPPQRKNEWAIPEEFLVDSVVDPTPSKENVYRNEHSLMTADRTTIEKMGSVVTSPTRHFSSSQRFPYPEPRNFSQLEGSQKGTAPSFLMAMSKGVNTTIVANPPISPQKQGGSDNGTPARTGSHQHVFLTTQTPDTSRVFDSPYTADKRHTHSTTNFGTNVVSAGFDGNEQKQTEADKKARMVGGATGMMIRRDQRAEEKIRRRVTSGLDLFSDELSFAFDTTAVRSTSEEENVLNKAIDRTLRQGRANQTIHLDTKRGGRETPQKTPGPYDQPPKEQPKPNTADPNISYDLSKKANDLLAAQMNELMKLTEGQVKNQLDFQLNMGEVVLSPEWKEVVRMYEIERDNVIKERRRSKGGGMKDNYDAVSSTEEIHILPAHIERIILNTSPVEVNEMKSNTRVIDEEMNQRRKEVEKASFPLTSESVADWMDDLEFKNPFLRTIRSDL